MSRLLIRLLALLVAVNFIAAPAMSAGIERCHGVVRAAAVHEQSAGAAHITTSHDQSPVKPAHDSASTGESCLSACVAMQAALPVILERCAPPPAISHMLPMGGWSLAGADISPEPYPPKHST